RARAYADIAKARAEVLHFPYGPVVGITVAGQGGDLIAPGNPVWGNLRDALRDHGDPQVELKLMGCQASTFRLGLKVKCDPDYEQDAVLEAVEAALRLAFAFQARRLGQPVQQSEVIATTHAVPGVIAVDLDLLYGGTDPHAQTLPGRHVRLLAS